MLVVCVRVLALLLVVQLSGVAHFIADTFFDDDMTCADEKQHSPDKGNCPLGGGHSEAEMMRSMPPRATELEIGAAQNVTAPAVPSRFLVLRGRSVIIGVFRPPRSLGAAAPTAPRRRPSVDSLPSLSFA
jgi:hypothetical protein